jgi:hypothetical protein
LVGFELVTTDTKGHTDQQIKIELATRPLDHAHPLRSLRSDDSQPYTYVSSARDRRGGRASVPSCVGRRGRNMEAAIVHFLGRGGSTSTSTYRRAFSPFTQRSRGLALR